MTPTSRLNAEAASVILKIKIRGNTVFRNVHNHVTDCTVLKLAIRQPKAQL
jgi:hypothetical protein